MQPLLTTDALLYSMLRIYMTLKRERTIDAAMHILQLAWPSAHQTRQNQSASKQLAHNPANLLSAIFPTVRPSPLIPASSRGNGSLEGSTAISTKALPSSAVGE